ncbi:uncharacterized protein LOC132728473 [Ruditapes philippinarum]|uniref:uncharacterized protein LOC132728473 n=1 Tax=Ruditapes philippinarum TaxID=129788 RepID=UPI00295B20B6|nr:uncharacterized protein LOC132728473 [Ruditapes philippinarum]
MVFYENTVLNTVRTGTDANRTRAEGENCHSDNRLTRIKCLMYTVLVMVILMYVVVIGIITIFVIYAPGNKVDGNWAQWSDWTSCDVTCGNGSQSRFRTCTNPTQTANGCFCTGSGTDISICKLTECQGRGDDIKDYNSTFSARLVKNIYRPPSFNDHEPIVFDEIMYNNMNGYDNSSGIFIAPVSGVYLFIYFIEIEGSYGRVELKLNKTTISKTTLSSMYVEISVFGSNNSVVFQNTNIKRTNNAVVDKISCLRERPLISSGPNITVVGFQQFMDRCPYKGGIRATGGDSIIIYAHAGSQVWIHCARCYYGIAAGTFTGVLLNEN